MKCSRCGVENANDSLFCVACGAQLIKPVTYENDPLNKGAYQNTDDTKVVSSNQFDSQYNGQYSNPYETQGNGQYSNPYDNPNNSQYNDPYNNPYNGQYSNPYETQGNGQYSNPYDNQNNGQYGGNNYYGSDPYQDQYSDQEWEEERNRRMEQRRQNRIAQQKKENRRIIVIGIIIAAVIAAGGIAAFFGIKYFMGSNEQASASSSLEVIDRSVKVKGNNETDSSAGAVSEITPTPAVIAEPTVEPETPTPTPEKEKPTPKPEVELTAQVKTASSVDRSGYSLVSISSAEASSTIKQEGYNNSVQMTYDGNATTSWQDGVKGDGIGEFLHYNLSREYDVRYITFKMGNWRDQSHFDENNRPKDITIWIGDESFEITIPDGMTEYCLELSKDVPADEVYIQIDSVYKAQWDDTCISEVGIYGR